MATETVQAAPEAVPAATGTDGVRPYAPSWMNVLIDWIERAPGSPWMVYVALAVVSVVLSNVQGWLAGISPVGQPSLVQSGWGIFTVAIVAMIHLFDRVARSAFDIVRPLTTVPEPEATRLRYDLTTIPARPALAITLLSIPLTVFPYVGDPAAAGVSGYPPVAVVLRAIVETFATAVLLILIYQAIRQLRCVTRILDRITRIDLFHQRPLYAFSRLTGGIGISLILVVAAGLVLTPSPTQTTSIYYFGWYILFLGFAVVVFVVPLLGLHGRLVAEKERLQLEADERLKGILTELNRDAAALELGRADGLNKTLSSLLQQREVLARLPTWPWSTTTLRAFVSAILLPLALFLVQRVLGQVV